MNPLKKRIVKRLLVGFPIDILGAVVTYWFSERWDMTVIVGACLLVGHLNDTFGTYLVLRRKYESEQAGDE